ncbi:hypothetical protein ACFL4K_00085 [Candidatus Neomarinimicrobiota bacterium]
MPKKQSLADHLTDKQSLELLAQHEVIRDPVHGDISITALERAIIDTEAFQRLRGLKQLGPTYLVYPGAVHTRFQHSIGTLHFTDTLVQIINQNHANYHHNALLRVEPYPHLLARLVALLHDAAHIPFGHTIEDEGNILSPEWADQKRVEKWLGQDQEIPNKIVKHLSNLGIEKKAIKSLISDVKSYVAFEGDQMALDFPYVYEVVSNTLCADLLDYIIRDMFFCGLPERSGDRVIRYLAIVKVQDDEEQLPLIPIKGRVVLLAYRFEPGHIGIGKPKLVRKPNIISEAIDLLRRRFSLAEKVYFHRTKIAASAMLISAVQEASFPMSNIYDDSDEGLIRKLLSDKNPRVHNLAEAFTNRRLYKPIYTLNYRKEKDTDHESIHFWQQVYPTCRSSNWRKEQERYIEQIYDFRPGSVAIYCPERKMNLKRFEMLVQSDPDSEVKQLEEILDDTRKEEMRAISERYQELWKMTIFIDPADLDVEKTTQRVLDVSRLCEDIVGIPNDIGHLRGKGRSVREQIASRVVEEYQTSHNQDVQYDTFQELVYHESRNPSENPIEDMKRYLENLMASPDDKQNDSTKTGKNDLGD